MSIFDSIDPFQEGLLASGQWLRVLNILCLVGAVLALVTSLWRMGMRTTDEGEQRSPVTAALLMPITVVAMAVGFWSIWNRYIEVNHFPSQTMSEVLVMTGWFCIVALFVLVLALGLGRMGSKWVHMQDAIYMAVFLGAWGINAYSTSLSTAQRDLPPALQSYWFPPHLVALIFSYVTLGIAGIIGIKYFCIRFWSGVFSGGRRVGAQLLLLAALTLVPFVQVVTIPVLVIVGLGFLVMKFTGRLPGREAVSSIEKPMDAISYRAFCVGIPFLTAGLFMGAFWAQEAWANYWGWDSKENSALITWLVYVVYIHLRMLGGYRGEKAMAVLVGGALSVFLTFQIFGYLPDSQKSLHRYTDDGVVPREGMQGKAAKKEESARLDTGQ